MLLQKAEKGAELGLEEPDKNIQNRRYVIETS